ncbi:Adhesion G protein-coupled receptor L2 [Nymphon striatum]|nr:Adhesion G protein-coupled receptor L2 [Nymphon striatum]
MGFPVIDDIIQFYGVSCSKDKHFTESIEQVKNQVIVFDGTPYFIIEKGISNENEATKLCQYFGNVAELEQNQFIFLSGFIHVMVESHEFQIQCDFFYMKLQFDTSHIQIKPKIVKGMKAYNFQGKETGDQVCPVCIGKNTRKSSEKGTDFCGKNGIFNPEVKNCYATPRQDSYKLSYDKASQYCQLLLHDPKTSVLTDGISPHLASPFTRNEHYFIIGMIILLIREYICIIIASEIIANYGSEYLTDAVINRFEYAHGYWASSGLRIPKWIIKSVITRQHAVFSDKRSIGMKIDLWKAPTDLYGIDESMHPHKGNFICQWLADIYISLTEHAQEYSRALRDLGAKEYYFEGLFYFYSKKEFFHTSDAHKACKKFETSGLEKMEVAKLTSKRLLSFLAQVFHDDQHYYIELVKNLDIAEISGNCVKSCCLPHHKKKIFPIGIVFYHDQDLKIECSNFVKSVKVLCQGSEPLKQTTKLVETTVPSTTKLFTSRSTTTEMVSSATPSRKKIISSVKPTKPEIQFHTSSRKSTSLPHTSTSTKKSTILLTSTTRVPKTCPSEIIYGVRWPEIRVHSNAILPCDSGYGQMALECMALGNFDELGPDMTNCSSRAIKNIITEIVKGIPDVEKAKLLKNTAEKAKDFSGEDMMVIVDSLKYIYKHKTAFKGEESVKNVSKVMDYVFDVADSLLKPSVESKWKSMKKDNQKKVATKLLQEVERIGSLAIYASNTSSKLNSSNLELSMITCEECVSQSSKFNVEYATSKYGNIAASIYSNDSQVKYKAIGSTFFTIIDFLGLENAARAGFWDASGCQVDKRLSKPDYTVCYCNHLTNFAVLMDVEDKIPHYNQSYLNTITFVLMVVSIISLMLTLLAHVTLNVDHMLKEHPNSINGILKFKLFSPHHFLILCTKRQILCGILAAVMEYFWLAAFMWMFWEGLPAVPITIAASIMPDNYNNISGDICWIKADDGFRWSFAGPIAAVILINIVIFKMAIGAAKRSYISKPRKRSFKLVLKGSASLMCILGLTWIFGFMIPLHPVFSTLFVIFNASQGLLIFFFHIVINRSANQEMAKILQRKAFVSTMWSSSTSTSTSMVKLFSTKATKSLNAMKKPKRNTEENVEPNKEIRERI